MCRGPQYCAWWLTFCRYLVFLLYDVSNFEPNPNPGSMVLTHNLCQICFAFFSSIVFVNTIQMNTKPGSCFAESQETRRTASVSQPCRVRLGGGGVIFAAVSGTGEIASCCGVEQLGLIQLSYCGVDFSLARRRHLKRYYTSMYKPGISFQTGTQERFFALATLWPTNAGFVRSLRASWVALGHRTPTAM